MWWKPTVKTCLTTSVLHSLFPPLLCRYRLYDSSGVHRWILSAPPEGSAGDRQHALHHWRTVHGQPHRRRLQLLTAEWMEVRDTGKQNILKHPTLGGNFLFLVIITIIIIICDETHLPRWQPQQLYLRLHHVKHQGKVILAPTIIPNVNICTGSEPNICWARPLRVFSVCPSTSLYSSPSISLFTFCRHLHPFLLSHLIHGLQRVCEYQAVRRWR